MGGSAHELTRYIINELDNNEKEMLAKDISLDEISKVIKILKHYQSVDNITSSVQIGYQK
jgi:hypothetical protein